jgi:hypothetical protein
LENDTQNSKEKPYSYQQAFRKVPGNFEESSRKDLPEVHGKPEISNLK